MIVLSPLQEECCYLQISQNECRSLHPLPLLTYNMCVCMLLLQVTDLFPQKAFMACFVCACVRRLTSSIVLASCWCVRAYLSSVKRAPQALLSHWPFTEQQRGEGQEKIDALTELFSQFFFLWLNLLFVILLICSSITGWQL